MITLAKKILMEIPKGKLIPVGGNEDKGLDESSNPIHFLESGILKRILSEMRGIDSRLEVITTASGVPRKTADNYLRAFDKLGCKHIGIMHLRKREHASKPEFLARLKKADGVLFTGGDQMIIAMTIGGTPFLDILMQRYKHENFIIAGTSAGAMAMSGTMIYEGSSIRALFKDEVKLTPGLGLVNQAIIDTHFMHRGRFGRLAQAVAHNPTSIGIGLGEDTGAIIAEENTIEIIGSGLVIIVDGHDISYSNITHINNGAPLTIENLKVHVMAKGNFFRLDKRKFYSNKEEMLNDNQLLNMAAV